MPSAAEVQARMDEFRRRGAPWLRPYTREDWINQILDHKLAVRRLLAKINNATKEN